MKKAILVLIALTLISIPMMAQPVITQQPTNQIVPGGANAIFNVQVSGTGPFTYQWQFNGTNLPNNTITTVVGTDSTTNSGDGGAATNASLLFPHAVIFDSGGNMYIADHFNDCIRKVDTNGIITTVAGNGRAGYSGDGGAATNARLSSPATIGFDISGSLYFSDQGNNRIRKVDANGIITTVAGNGSGSYSGDGGAATNAALNACYGVAFDASGNLFISDTYNNRIRKVNATSGIITTVAGTGVGAYSGDGGAATNARLSQPLGMAFDDDGNLYFADSSNSRIRKIATNGVITTIAGNGNSTYNGDGILATNAALNYPFTLTFDATGKLFIAEFYGYRIRVVDTNGIITTVVGNGRYGYSGDGGAATNAAITSPAGITFDTTGNLYFSDLWTNRVREVHYAGLPYVALTNVNLTNAGNYTVVITSPYGSVQSSIAALTVVVPPQHFTGQIAGNGGLQLQFFGTPGYPYILQSTTNLTPPINWQPTVTNMADASGYWQFIETNLDGVQKFYRAVGQ